jgi:hypothetical protein
VGGPEAEFGERLGVINQFLDALAGRQAAFLVLAFDGLETAAESDLALGLTELFDERAERIDRLRRGGSVREIGRASCRERVLAMV